jgi:chorismate synthase
MNTFGRKFKVSIFGESHGPLVGITIDGCMPGISINESDFTEMLNRRRGGEKKGTTMRAEKDEPVFVSGVFNGKTTGAPLTIVFYNQDKQSSDYETFKKIPRPGHADFVASKKFNGFEDYRGGGHFSGRLTVCLVAAGVVAQKQMEAYHKSDHAILIRSKIEEIAGFEDIEKGIQFAIEKKDSVGGIVSCSVENLPIGIGEPFFDSIESVLSHALFSIPAIKGIEFGCGFEAAKMLGSQHNDSIMNQDGKTATNHSGGISGGISNGNTLYYRVVVKPTSSTPQMQTSLNQDSGIQEDFVVRGRHDLCIALRVPPVLEAVTTIALLDLMMSS